MNNEWVTNFKNKKVTDLNLSNQFEKIFPTQKINKKTLEQTKLYIIKKRLRLINDFVFPNPKCKCSQKCNYMGLCKILNKTESQIEKNGYNPYVKIGLCWNSHYCFGLCDGCEKIGNRIICKYTGREYKNQSGYGFDKFINRTGKKHQVRCADNIMDLIHSKKNIDLKLNDKEVKLKNDLYKWNGFGSKKERKVIVSEINFCIDKKEMIELIQKLTFKKSFTSHENENVMFYIFSKKLSHFFRNISVEQFLISTGVLNLYNIFTLPEYLQKKLDIPKFSIPKSDLKIIKIFEDKMLRILTGFFRLKKELPNIINIQKKQLAETKKYLTDKCYLRKYVPDYFEMYNMLYFDNKWKGDKITMFLTWNEWIEILNKSLIIWQLCKLCGKDKNIGSISIVPEHLIVSILNLQSEGWKYNNTVVIEKNLILSEPFFYLRLNNFSRYGINPKIHKNGMKILDSSLKYLCMECGVKFIYECVKSSPVEF